jgi:tetratricopeptide (TPR) repeat protein
MVDHYHRVGQEAAPHLLGENQHEWLDKLAIVYPNIQAAITWAITHKQLELIESFITNLERFWLIRGYLAEQLQLYQSLFDLAGTARNNATLHYDYAYMLYRTGDYVSAQEQAVFAFDLATTQADAKAIALARHMLGIMADETGDSELALEHYQASMAFFQAQEDDDMIRALFKDLYVATANLGQDELAKHYCEQHYALASEQGDQREVGIALLHLGSISLEQADYPRAKDYFLESMTVRSRLQDKLGLADVHASLAWLALVEQRYQDAKTAAGTAVQLCLAIGEQYVSTYAYSHLAVAEAELGHYAAAWRHFARALRVCRELGVKQEGLLCLERVAYYLTAHTQHAPEAARFLFGAEHIRTTLKLPRFKVEPNLTPTWHRLQAQLPKDVLHECEQQERALCFSDALDEADQLLRTLFDDSTFDDSTHP